MSSLQAAYIAQIAEAGKLWGEGKPQTALDICWRLRLQADLGLYSRVQLNLLISCIVGPQRSLKFAKECLSLLDIVLEDNEGKEGCDREREHVASMQRLAHRVVAAAENPQTNFESTNSIGSEATPAKVNEVSNVAEERWVVQSDDWDDPIEYVTGLPHIEGAFARNRPREKKQDTTATVDATDALSAHLRSLSVYSVSDQEILRQAQAPQYAIPQPTPSPTSPPQINTSSENDSDDAA